MGTWQKLESKQRFADVSNPLGWDGDCGFEAADQYFNTISNVAVDES